MLRSIMVRAVRDDEAQGWVASSENVPALIEELIELNDIQFDGSEIPVHIFAEIPARVANPRAAA